MMIYYARAVFLTRSRFRKYNLGQRQLRGCLKKHDLLTKRQVILFQLLILGFHSYVNYEGRVLGL